MNYAWILVTLNNNAKDRFMVNQIYFHINITNLSYHQHISICIMLLWKCKQVQLTAHAHHHISHTITHGPKNPQYYRHGIKGTIFAQACRNNSVDSVYLLYNNYSQIQRASIFQFAIVLAHGKAWKVVQLMDNHTTSSLQNCSAIDQGRQTKTYVNTSESTQSICSQW